MATNKSSNPLTSMSAGCIAGFVEATAVWPMEFIKTQLQLGSKSGSKLPYNGMLQGLSYTVRQTGFLRYVVAYKFLFSVFQTAYKRSALDLPHITVGALPTPCAI